MRRSFFVREAKMAFGDSYLTLSEFKTRTRSATDTNDAAITAVLASASRSIDEYCGREFNVGAADEERIYDSACWSSSPLLSIDDFVTITEIASDDGSGTYPTVWDATTYTFAPRNAAVRTWPYTDVIPAKTQWWAGWPFTGYPIRVTGTFGWSAVPAPVKEVCFMAANRLKSLWDAPFGLSGGGEAGQLDMTVSLTPILKEMLNPYRKFSLVAV